MICASSWTASRHNEKKEDPRATENDVADVM